MEYRLGDRGRCRHRHRLHLVQFQATKQPLEQHQLFKLYGYAFGQQ
jgi:hypothetical protein